MERKLAHVEIIKDIQPIPNADMIEVATVLGWKVVVKKNEFKVGDKTCYCEIDSILPDKPEFEFLRARGFRIKTIKMKKQISQGICFPLNVLPAGEYIEGQDVTEVLGVTKWELQLPASLAGQVKRMFPTHLVSKTDECRIQAEPALIDEFKGKEVYISLKVDGTSATFIHKDGETDVCSRNLSLKEDDKNVYWKMFRKYNIADIFARCGNIAIQGECAGVGIQKNPLGLSDVQLFVFRVVSMDDVKIYSLNDMRKFCVDNGLQMVPILQEGIVFDFTVEQLLEMACGKYDGTKNHREGIVIRPMIPCYSETLQGMLSVKVINNDYLLEEK
jgi:RNA ligase (TIGR02306 family)